MAEMRHISPEERLLRVIESGELKPDSLFQNKLDAATLEEGFFARLFQEWHRLIHNLPNWGKGWGGKGPSSALQTVNRMLVGILLGLTCFVVYDSFAKKRDIETFLKSAPAPKVVPSTKSITALQQLSYYLDPLNKRNVFQPFSATPESGQSSVQTLKQMTEGYKIVGISWGQEPEAMISDTKASKTFFLKKGQKIGKFEVKAIEKDKVILSYQNQEITLF